MKLTNQFTSPEQAGRLLAAGLPEWTADCYYTRMDDGTELNRDWLGPILLTFSGYRVADVRKKEEDYARDKNTDPKNLKKRNPVRYLPDEVLACWSTGRLIEIWLKCVNPEWHDSLHMIESDAKDLPAYMTNTFIHCIAGDELYLERIEN